MARAVLPVKVRGFASLLRSRLFAKPLLEPYSSRTTLNVREDPGSIHWDDAVHDWKNPTAVIA